jgi:hypothetical protein
VQPSRFDSAAASVVFPAALLPSMAAAALPFLLYTSIISENMMFSAV